MKKLVRKTEPARCFAVAAALGVLALDGLAAAPDIDMATVPADLAVPHISDGEPAAGKRIIQKHPDYSETEAYHSLYLPVDWKPGNHYPVIVEYAGNRWGETSSGRVEGSKLGYGLSGGEGFIWLCLPYLNAGADANVRTWWGDKPDFDAGPTVDYCKKVLPWVCENYGGDQKRVVLAGFSRGAIACNFIGLHDDEIAELWCGFIPFSHYDGVNEQWPYPGAHRAAALERLKRLGARPQFILNEGGDLEISPTRQYLKRAGVDLARIKFQPTGFLNHDDAWILRPSRAREVLREWLKSLTKP